MKKKNVTALTLRKETVATLTHAEKKVLYGGSDGNQNPDATGMQGCSDSSTSNSNCPTRYVSCVTCPGRC